MLEIEQFIASKQKDIAQDPVATMCDAMLKELHATEEMLNSSLKSIKLTSSKAFGR